MQIKKFLLLSVFAVSLIPCNNVVGPEILNADVFEVFDGGVSDIFFFDSGDEGWAIGGYLLLSRGRSVTQTTMWVADCIE
ncbi:MAG: hypothetical protein GY771_06350 [bacterium]|nr:hypothetical protein [bacterium]